MSTWAERFPEKARAKSRRWQTAFRKAHPRLARAKQRAYYKANPERVRQYAHNAKRFPKPLRPRPEFCECCGSKPNGQGVLHLDHCHETNKFMGWLCHSCNIAIGHLGDNLLGVLKAVKYLRRKK
jgi:hypothetical protein